jgi:integrase
MTTEAPRGCRGGTGRGRGVAARRQHHVTSEANAAGHSRLARAARRRPSNLAALRCHELAVAVVGAYAERLAGKVDVAPVPDVATGLARLGQRAGVEMPAARAREDRLRRRYTAAVKRAGLRPLPFHSLRHYFGSMAVNRATLVQVQSWMGHSHIQTTARYLHSKATPTTPRCSPERSRRRSRNSQRAVTPAREVPGGRPLDRG